MTDREAFRHTWLAPVAIAFSLAFPYPAPAKWPEGTKPFATATLSPKSGSSVQGTVDFARAGDKLLVRITVDNLSSGQHGFHVHDKGDCSAADGSSAGDHYNPTAEKHGGPKARHRHVGDLGNLRGGKKTRPVELVIPKPVAAGVDWEGIVGRSVVIHADRDDLVTDPSGNSGARIACGVIQAVPSTSGE